MSKAKIRKTGEVVDVIYFRCSTIRNICDEVSYIDSKGIEHEGENLNYYWDFENIPNSDAIIDWEQRRYEIAKDIMAAIYTRPDKRGTFLDYNGIVAAANGLIRELKKGTEQ